MIASLIHNPEYTIGTAITLGRVVMHYYLFRVILDIVLGKD